MKRVDRWFFVGAAIVTMVAMIGVGHDLSSRPSTPRWDGARAIACARDLVADNPGFPFARIVVNCAHPGYERAAARSIGCAAELDYTSEGNATLEEAVAACGGDR